MKSVLLLLLPRSAISYPFYVVAVFFMLSIGRKEAIKLGVVTVVSGAVFFALSLVYGISIVAFLIELPLILPFICYCLGFSIRGMDHQSVIRVMSSALLLLSVFNMVINYGFPFKLPYIHYLPDAYGALFGLGGAKIVTVLGFFSILAEIYGKNKSRLFLLIAITNFLMPSYLLGVACGMAALGIVFIRSSTWFLITVGLAATVFSYVIYRLDNMDFSVYFDFGMLPKVYAYYAVIQMYLDEPVTFFLGSGIGQFASTSALWASDYLSEMSSHGIPKIPGFYMSEFHDIYLGKVLDLGVNNFWAISSSFNKPYTSISTLYAEIGVIAATWLGWRFIKVTMSLQCELTPRLLLLVFTGLMFAIDTWHDNPWFMLGLFLIVGMLNEKDSASNTRPS